MLRLSREALPMRRGSYRVQRLSVKRNTSQTDQAGKYFLLTFERAFFGLAWLLLASWPVGLAVGLALGSGCWLWLLVWLLDNAL